MPKPTHLTLGAYVRRRNGVPLGHPDSLRNMLRRSLGADTFYGFWLYWNPIWGYYLGRWILRPASRVLPAAVAVWITFVVSGAFHDLAASVVKGRPIFFLTPWFALMGLFVLLSKASGYSLRAWSWVARASANVAVIVATYLIVRFRGAH